ncbi:hypothetical protein [Streptomyces sp. MJP52]|uniref:hypothetical protein n=1 Tax=Streptomyces sp. MJP52 TaxID=2940555 RepID=UPI0024752CBE|nr:hypothetical protein [Streptomyces sp. MJP52]MDH6226226.1 hypothetical protein [Streptomyces sp. MJP52]
MPYQYRCTACDAHGDRHDTRQAAEDDRDRHRQLVHGGLAPTAGDHVAPVHHPTRGDGCLPSGSALFFAALLLALLANCWGR